MQDSKPKIRLTEAEYENLCGDLEEPYINIEFCQNVEVIKEDDYEDEDEYWEDPRDEDQVDVDENLITEPDDYSWTEDDIEDDTEEEE